MAEYTTHDTYPIRLKDGRKATLTLPVGLTADDCARITAWVSLLAQCAAEDRVTEAAMLPARPTEQEEKP